MHNLENLDFVYILGIGSRWHDNEIRYSIRSVFENAPHRRIVVVGKKPKFLQNILHIPAEDDFGNKLQNAISKLRVLCMTEGISEDFVLMNDDFFLLRKIESLPNFTNGTLAGLQQAHETKGGYYFASIGTTLTLLRFSDIAEPRNFEVHAPMILNRSSFLKMTDAISWKEKPYLFRSIYGNIFGLPSKDRKDCKIFSATHLEKHDNLDIVSTDNPVVLSPRFQKWIQAKFPHPSKYELSK